MSMLTRWGKALDSENVLQEYPRPQMVRESYINLNGYWDYAITDDRLEHMPDTADGKILVPFSPEAPLSGVGRSLLPDQKLWYRRAINLNRQAQSRLLLHFGAVDQCTSVYINNSLVCDHAGGYRAFEVDITDFVSDGENVLTVMVTDGTDSNELSRGKQKTKRGGIWYTPQSGIWQTVWMEWVPEKYIKSLRITPAPELNLVDITLCSDAAADCAIIFNGKRIEGRSNEPIHVPVDTPELWSPESPKLYEFTAELGEDKISSYFALRSFGRGTDEKGHPCLLLNGKPYFHSGVLDQGYWPDGLYTAPSDEAMVYDITLMKSMGFNMLRKHIKIEPLRWYYHCDRLGMLVWQDMMSGGGEYDFMTISAPLITHLHKKDNDYRRFARTDEYGRRMYYVELEDMIKQLYNCPCIAMWVPFNEGWGQFDAARAFAFVKSLDSTRTIDHASGWHDQGVSDVKSLHVYFYPYVFKPDKHGRAVVLSEFGGYKLNIAGHTWNDADFGYRGFKSQEALGEAFKKLYEKQILTAREKGLAASVYTQLSDVEDEINGFVTYDREIVKFDVPAVRDINERLIAR
jgi:beta-galactosidase/beta-glucuronidase